jgi:transcriptional regulator with PAS, ATPase and Fis domain
LCIAAHVFLKDRSEQAQGKAMFMDEAVEMPQEMQALLLRVL